MSEPEQEQKYSPRALRAKGLFEEGYNCAQAVLLSFCDETGLDQETAAKLASSFGGGIGRLREVCGTVSGAFMALGLIHGASDPKDTEGKSAQYRDIQDIAGKFREENGSIVCRELLALTEKKSEPTPEKRTNEYYHKRPCGELVAYSTQLLEQYLEKRKLGDA